MPPLPPPLRSRDPRDTILTTIRDTVSCSWIFYSNSSSSGAEGAAPATEPDPDLDSMHMMLDPHLRPISPDLTNEESKRIFEEHKQLAQEYLKIQTELAYLSKHKSELEEKMDDEELRQKREIIQLENEKDSLIKLYCTLKNQVTRAENESWLLGEDAPHQ
ncbi:unnamed protein product [Pieris macdunnoughi]|uniref:Mitogen-activated protein kinase kinase kinase n=1 Tax=Pieris macdunnoughi TaxID=345717 RepID=A0A821PTR4_9NEOP|nr:unnamed protein product [Pieris macdunnoughi]